METKTYVRKPVYVEAVMVTPENLEEVAAWCEGKVLQREEDVSIPYVKIKVNRVRTNRHTQAFFWDWVLRFEDGFKVFTAENFEKHWEVLGNEPQPGDEEFIKAAKDMLIGEQNPICQWCGNPMGEDPPDSCSNANHTPVDALIPYGTETDGEIPEDMGPEAPGPHEAEVTDEPSLIDEVHGAYPADTTIGGTPASEINVGQ